MPKKITRIGARRLINLEMLVMDVDGVMTDGKLYYSAEGHVLKAFDVQDGQGLKNLRATNVRTAIISSSSASLIGVRAHELGINSVLLDQTDKGIAMVQLIAETGCSPENVIYIGDDIPDIAAMRQVGNAITVPNAHAKVLAAAEFVTTRSGGAGAIRELCDLICAAKFADVSG